VYGPIRDKWASLGWETGSLSYPASNPVTIANGGSKQEFRGGAIYFKPELGAFPVSGLIRGYYLSMGAENSIVGYPRADPTRTFTVSGWATVQRFQGGKITCKDSGSCSFSFGPF